MDIKKVSQYGSTEEGAVHREGHKFDKDKSFDYDQITDEIFLGSNMCCQMGYKDELLFKDIKADISLEKERIDNPQGVDFFLWIPIEDKHAPTDNQLELGVANLDYFARSKVKVYIHCKHGHGRAPTIVAGYFISQGHTVQQAIDIISAKRPEIHLENVQIEALQRYQERKPFHTFL